MTGVFLDPPYGEPSLARWIDAIAEGGWLDELTFDAANLGNEPHSWAELRARGVGRWDLTARYRSSDFFYRDAGYFFRDGGDLHAWDTDRSSFGLDFRVKAADWITLRAGGERMGQGTRAKGFAKRKKTHLRGTPFRGGTFDDL